MAKQPTYRPLNDLVLIDPDPDPTYAEQTGTKLIIPDKYKYGPIDPPKWGKVIAKGPLCKDGGVRLGARVLYAKFGWAKLQVDEKKHLALVREYDLLAVEV